MTDDYYRYDRAGHVIAGFRSGNSYRLGDAVRVTVAAVNVDTRELDFRLLAGTGSPTKTRVNDRLRRAAKPIRSRQNRPAQTKKKSHPGEKPTPTKRRPS